ncbi:adenylate/guanylate cyclase domain-containing protein [Tumidithrix elongata RA019]|uniref:Adenylate cyclase n=1 Tax=Tumidithrix elongata BACA0141 TaxID=2716417 RepID=A0AAW9PSE7_9CYAN|nr:adenylate/guanylate cyclase domain-containing protein [Tumidithrix elongata RA019]
MNSTATKLLLPHHIEYLIVDQNLVIQFASVAIARFVEFEEDIEVGQDIRLAFPELFGYEEILMAIVAGDRANFELKAVTRILENRDVHQQPNLNQDFNSSLDSENFEIPRINSPIYIDIYINKIADLSDCLVVFVEEVTDKMALEQALVQSLNEMHLLAGALDTSSHYIDQVIASMAEALLLVTPSGKIKTVNQSAQSLFGYTSEELVNQSLSLLSNDPKLLILDREQTQRMEAVCRRKDGECLLISFSRTVFFVEPDSSPTWIYIGRDITDRKYREVKLLENEELYRVLFESVIDLMFENTSDLIQWVTSEGQFVYINHAWRDTLGYTLEDATPSSIFEIIHPDCQTEFRENFDAVLAGESIEQIVAVLCAKDNQKIWAEGTINCKFSEGKPMAVLVIFRDITPRLKIEALLNQEKKNTERLLLNILPAPIVAQLKQLDANTNINPSEAVIAQHFADTTVLFADIVGFTQIAATLNPTSLIDLLNHIFSVFDRLTEKHGLEKIKTIGDAYMVVGGVPMPKIDHAEAIADMALDMQGAIAQFQLAGIPFSMRIGIHTGPVIAGVIGIKKFIYDLWGNTVNIASRMESQGKPRKIQVTDTTYERLKERYILQERGMVRIKGKGDIKTYWLIGKK